MSKLLHRDPPVPSLRHNLGSTVVPGDRIGRMIVDSTNGSGEKIVLTAGRGTYLRGGQIYASVLGTLQGEYNNKTAATANAESDDDTNRDTTITATMILSVQPSKGYFAQQEVLSVGQIILGRVVRIHNSQQVIVSILAVQDVGQLLTHNPEGVIRKEDVRTIVAGATDQQQVVQLQNSFRSNDIILAKVLSMGDTRKYYLSTAEPGLGVIYAVSAVSKKPMIPISWKEMECPETGLKELRKCAKPPT